MNATRSVRVEDGDTLELDNAAQVSVMIVSIETVMSEMRALQRAILRA